MNLTIDPDLYKKARRAFNVLDMNMSGYVEHQLAVFLQVMTPFEPLMDDIEAGKVDPAALKTAMRSFGASGAVLVGDMLSEFGQMQREIGEMTREEVPTDKK